MRSYLDNIESLIVNEKSRRMSITWINFQRLVKALHCFFISSQDSEVQHPCNSTNQDQFDSKAVLAQRNPMHLQTYSHQVSCLPFSSQLVNVIHNNKDKTQDAIKSEKTRML